MRFSLLVLALALSAVGGWSASAIEFDAVGANFSNARVEADTFGATTTATISTSEARDGGLDVGRVVDVDPAQFAVASPCQPQQWPIAHKSANAIALEFAQLSLPPGHELVAVAANGKEVRVVPSPDGAETVTEGVPGASLTLEYRPREEGCSGVASFALTKLHVRDNAGAKEAVCGANTMQNAKCFADNGVAQDAAMYAASRAVLRTQRVRADGRIVVCSAWLWGSKGHIVTNHHCFSSQAMVNAAQFDFGVEAASCAAKCSPGSCPIARAVKGRAGVKFLASDAKLDVALLQLTGAAAEELPSQYGFLKILFGMPTVGDEIYIPQHPGGGARQIAKTDDDSNEAIATIKAVNAKVSVDNVLFSGLLGYAADTESGSSGSPVISRASNLVVGLHRIGYCNNAATPSKALLGFLVPLAKGNDGLDA